MLILTILVLYVTMVYGPIAALLVELFPARIRYTSMSLPYHIGNGWFGGFLPTTAFAMVAATGDIYYGLWYPVAVAALTVVVGLVFLPETRKRDILVIDQHEPTEGGMAATGPGAKGRPASSMSPCPQAKPSSSSPRKASGWIKPWLVA